MTTKTFKSDTMIQALQTVQAELGAAAIVVSMREIPLGPLWNPWQKAGVEVVASAPPAAGPAILRPAANAAGVEFVEEKPEIEWDLPVDRDSLKRPPPLKLNLDQPAAGGAAPVSQAAPKTAAQAAGGASER